LQQADRDREKQIESQKLRVQAIESTAKIWVNEFLPEFQKKRNSRRIIGKGRS
jgi:hypothetical protein